MIGIPASLKDFFAQLDTYNGLDESLIKEYKVLIGTLVNSIRYPSLMPYVYWREYNELMDFIDGNGFRVEPHVSGDGYIITPIRKEPYNACFDE